MLKLSNNRTRAQISEEMDTTSTGFIRPYGTTGPVFSSAAIPGILGTTWKDRWRMQESNLPLQHVCQPLTHSPT